MHGQLVIVRHGETDWNAEGRMQGHKNVGLSKKGDTQARLVSRRLELEHFDVVYSSDLCRATNTARIILGSHSVLIHETSILREVNEGIFEGLTREEIRIRYPDLFIASLAEDLDFSPPGGESVRQASVRLAAMVSELKASWAKAILIVGHGKAIQILIVGLLGLPLEMYWRFINSNCSVSMFDTYLDHISVRLYNDTSHLETGIRSA